jgi:hypothetical protein
VVMVRSARIVTPVSWIAAPEWLSVEQASELGGHDPEVLEELIWEGGLEAKQEDDTWTIERESLHDFQECLWLVQHWKD